MRAAMPGFIAKKLCPDLVIVKTNFDKYRAVSKQIQEIMAQYDPHFSPMGLDESYLDLTDYVRDKFEETSSYQLIGAGQEGELSPQEPSMLYRGFTEIAHVAYSPSFCLIVCEESV